MKKKLATAALAAAILAVPLAPASADHNYQPPNYWLCKPFPFLCGGR